MGNPEGIPQTVLTDIAHQVFGVAITGVLQRNFLIYHVGTDVIHLNLVTQQRMHAIHGNKFLGKGVGHPVIVGGAGTYQPCQRMLQ